MLWLYEHTLQKFFQNWNIFHQRNKTRTKIAYEHKANENLIEQQISFPMCKTIRKVTTKQLFELFYFFANRNK